MLAARRSKSTRKLSLWKRILFVSVALLSAIVTSELASLAAFWIRDGHPLPWAGVWKKQRAIINYQDHPESRGDSTLDVLHPYVGFVFDPTRSDSISEYGYDEPSPIQHRSDDAIIIGIFGGSVARHFASQMSGTLTKFLQRSPHFSGKRLVFVSLALGGYKQPQQLMALNYVLALGGEFDIVINIDGFNEVALHEPENAVKNVFPIYPRNWYPRMSAVPDPDLRRLVGEKSYLERRRASWAASFSSPVLRYSITCNLIWDVRDQSLLRECTKVSDAIRNYKPHGQEPYFVTGPRIKPQSDEDLYDQLVSIWKRCSLQMDRLCRANHVRYFHFLQPNQRVPDSKPMSKEERRIAFEPNHPYDRGTMKGYPLLISGGSSLAHHGVRFTDLTMIFHDEERAVYRDSCCHFNTLGLETIAAKVAEVILDDYRRDDS